MRLNELEKETALAESELKALQKNGVVGNGLKSGAPNL